MTEQKNKSYEEELMEFKNILSEINKHLANQSFNFIKTYVLPVTPRKKLKFHNDTANTPIRTLEIVNIGGGLILWINGNEGTTVAAGRKFENVEINDLDYEVASGTANITIYTRI